jgi:voltage-gated potassium channel
VFISFLIVILIVERQSPEASINSVFEAIWYGFVTIAAVGYGDYAPVTFLGRLLGLVLVIGSIALMGILTGQLTNEIRKIMEEKKLGLHGTKMKNHFVVIGWDHFGMNVVKYVLDSGKDVAIITNDPSDIDLIYNSFDNKKVFVLFSDFNKTDNFKLANIQHSLSVFINFDDDSETLVHLINIKKLYKDLKFVVSLNNGELRDTFHAAGVTFSVSNNEVASKLVASYIFEPDVADYTEDIMASANEADDFDLVEYEVNKNNPYLNTDYFNAFVDIKQQFNCVLMGISRLENNDYKLIKNPKKGELINLGDYMILLADGSTKPVIEKLFGVSEGRVSKQN